MSRLEKLKDNRNQNLVYSRTEENKEPVSYNKFYIFLVLALFGGLIYVIVFSGLFTIKKIEVEGYDHPETIEEVANEEVGKNIITQNILFFSTRNLKDTLLGDPNVKNIKLRKIFPSTVKIEVEAAEPKLIWSSAGERFLVDSGGVVMGPVQDQKLITIFDASNIKVKAGERVASPTFIKFIYDISDGFTAATGTKIAKITLFDLLTDVHILSSAGWTVYLDASKVADSQLKNLSRVLKEAKKDHTSLQYIDMRLDDRIYYK